MKFFCLEQQETEMRHETSDFREQSLFELTSYAIVGSGRSRRAASRKSTSGATPSRLKPDWGAAFASLPIAACAKRRHGTPFCSWFTRFIPEEGAVHFQQMSCVCSLWFLLNMSTFSTLPTRYQFLFHMMYILHYVSSATGQARKETTTHLS